MATDVRAAKVHQQAVTADLSRRLAACEAARTEQYARLTASHDAATLALITQVDTLTAALTALCDALAAEEAHTHTPAPDNDLAWYCAEGRRLRDETRRCRERARATLCQERTP
jgi:hypothetical protein